MEKIKHAFFNPFYFKIIATVIFVVSTTKYTGFIYDYGVYAIVIWGGSIFWINTFFKKFKLKKIDYLIYIFILGYFVTIITNSDDGIVVQAFVLLCSCMYFYSFFSVDRYTLEDFRRESYVIMFIIVAITFIFLLISYGMFVYDMISGTNNTYNIHGGSSIQFMGIYNGIATQACISGISMLSSLSLISIAIRKDIRLKKLFIIFNVTNFVMQDIAVTISYTTAGILSTGMALMVGLVLIILDKGKQEKRKVTNVILAVLIAVIICLVNYMVTDYAGSKFINALAENKQETSELQADEAISGIYNSNGRMPIWEEGIKQWKEQPLFGNGYGDFYVRIDLDGDDGSRYIEYRNMHSGYLELLNSCGILGFLSIMSFGMYYILKFFISLFKTEGRYRYMGPAMIIIYACLYAAINQLFILDRSINVLILCIFMGLGRFDFHKTQEN